MSDLLERRALLPTDMPELTGASPAAAATLIGSLLVVKLSVPDPSPGKRPVFVLIVDSEERAEAVGDAIGYHGEGLHAGSLGEFVTQHYATMLVGAGHPLALAESGAALPLEGFVLGDHLQKEFDAYQNGGNQTWGVE